MGFTYVMRVANRTLVEASTYSIFSTPFLHQPGQRTFWCGFYSCHQSLSEFNCDDFPNFPGDTVLLLSDAVEPNSINEVRDNVADLRDDSILSATRYKRSRMLGYRSVFPYYYRKLKARLKTQKESSKQVMIVEGSVRAADMNTATKNISALVTTAC